MNLTTEQTGAVAVVRVGAASHPMPYQKDLELATLPGPAEIVAAVRSLVSA